MPSPIKRKYKIYKQLQSEIWGHILLKFKLNEITFILIRQFEFSLRKYKNVLRKWSLKVFKIKTTKDFKSYGLNLHNNFIQPIIKLKNLHDFKLGFKYAFVVRKKLFKVWRIRQRQKFSSINKFLKLDLVWPRQKSDSKAEILSFSKKKKTFRKRKDSIYNFRKLYLKKGSHKQSKINWLNIKLLEKSISYFYGFPNVKKFKVLQDSAFYINKLRVNAIFKIEGMLSTVIFRLNWAPSCYMSKSMIRHGCISINNFKVYNSNLQLKLFQDISFAYAETFYYIQDFLRERLIRGSLLLNVPNYFEVNYRIMHASFWRYPVKAEIIGPYSFPFGRSPYNWSVSSFPVRR